LETKTLHLSQNINKFGEFLGSHEFENSDVRAEADQFGEDAAGVVSSAH